MVLDRIDQIQNRKGHIFDANDIKRMASKSIGNINVKSRIKQILVLLALITAGILIGVTVDAANIHHNNTIYIIK